MSFNWLSPLADWLSLFGFALTVWVLLVTNGLRRDFTLRGRTPEIRKSLASRTRSLLEALNAVPAGKKEIAATLAECRALLENLKLKLPRRERGDVTALISRLKGKKQGFFKLLPVTEYNDDELWNIFADLQGIVASLEQREKDATWS
jgi:hypothetical protein